MVCSVTDCAILKSFPKYLSKNTDNIVLIGTVVGGILVLLTAVLYSQVGIHSTTVWTVGVGGLTFLAGSALFGLVIFCKKKI